MPREHPAAEERARGRGCVPGCVTVREEATGSKYLRISGRHSLFLLLMDPEVAKPHLNASFLVGA